MRFQSLSPLSAATCVEVPIPLRLNKGRHIGPLRRIIKDVVSLVDELKPPLSLREWVPVGMIFLGEPPVGLLDLLRSGVSGDAEDGIVVLEARQTIRSFQRSLLKRSG